MAIKDRSARTMRIDICPDLPDESLAKKKEPAEARRGAGDSSAFPYRTTDYGYGPGYEKLLQSIYDAVLITDSNGQIIDFNTRALDFFLCGEEELSGNNIVDLISGADKSHLSVIRNNLKEERYTLIEAYCVRRDESMFPAEIAANRIDLDEKGQLCFLIRDISVRKRAQEALEEAMARLEVHDRARFQFVSNVSHDLRTPLTSMIYTVSNILRGVVGPVSDRVRRYLEILEGDCKRLSATVNDILDLRNIESKTLKLTRTKVPFSRLVRRSMQSLRVQAEKKFLTMDVSIVNRGWFVYCDPQKMERVILNIAGNAVKFTPGGGTIAVTVEDDPKRAKHVVLTIQDTGIGIPPEAIPRVMERYFTVGEQSSGSGLGLAISKEIVELHGGSIEIESPPPGKDRGTVVRVALPVVDPPIVLIVDDEKSVLDLLTRQMTAQGYRVIGAYDGLNALDRLEKDKPDIVVLDLVLPKLEGAEVILKMKSNKDMMRIPVIVVTGVTIGGDTAQILNSFAIPALPKPWQEAELLDWIEGVFLGQATLSR